MPFIERVIGIVEPKIPIDYAMAAINERARGAAFSTDAQLHTFMEGITGPLTAAELAQLKLLSSSISGITGTAAGPKADRLDRQRLIQDVFALAETRMPPYDSASFVRSRLGLPVE